MNDMGEQWRMERMGDGENELGKRRRDENDGGREGEGQGQKNFNMQARIVLTHEFAFTL